jgi:MFS family permease
MRSIELSNHNCFDEGSHLWLCAIGYAAPLKFIGKNKKVNAMTSIKLGEETTSPGLFRWFGELSGTERHALWASFGGFGLDGMDILLYSFVVPTLIAMWSMSQAQAGLIATTALLVSSLGGWIGGLLSDRFGRSVTLQITVVWFSFFTALSGLTNGFEQLLAVRSIQGLGFGAEWAVGAALIGEMVQPRNRGKVLGFVQSAYAVGWGIATLVYTIVFAVLPDHTAWRVLFFVGLLPALFVIYLRRYVPESRVFERQHAKAGPGRVSDIFKSDMIKVTLASALLATGVQGGYYAVMTWLPTFLRTVRHLTVLNSSGYLVVVIAASWIGYIFGGYVTDYLGRRLGFAIFSICSILTVLTYTLIPVSDGMMLFLGFPLGFFASGTYSGIGAYLTELFPTRIRGSGMGFAYNSGRAIGATFPALVGALSAKLSLGTAVGLFTAAAYAMVFLAICVLPETKGLVLKD